MRLNERLEHDCGLTVFQPAATSAARASSRLGSRYRQAVRWTGLSLRTRLRRRLGARPRRIGAGDLHEAVLAIVSYLLGSCPSCGKESFGNVDVYSMYVLRGCGACKYKESVQLPPIRKKIMYLDQFFLSHAFRGSDARFIEAACRIEKLAALQLLVVPYSSVHEDETHQWERHAELFKFIKATSRGHEFSPAYDVERVQLEKAFDAWLAGTPAKFALADRDVYRDNVHIWEGYYRIDVGRYTGDRDLIRSLKEQSIHELVATFEGWRQSKKTFEQDLQEEYAAAGRLYMQSFEELLLRVGQADFSAFLNAPIISMSIHPT